MNKHGLILSKCYSTETMLHELAKIWRFFFYFFSLCWPSSILLQNLLANGHTMLKSTQSRQILEVTQRWAWSVLGWVTAWEHRVQLAFSFFYFNYYYDFCFSK